MSTKLFSMIMLSLWITGCATQASKGLDESTAWRLNNDFSSLSFVSIKAADIGESHVFDRLSGSLSAGGEFRLEIDLSSVNTAIPIRDQRMMEHVFEGTTADITGTVPMTEIQSLVPGQSLRTQLQGTLNLNGQKTPIGTEVLVTRVNQQGGLMVATTRPVLLNAQALGIHEGVKVLQNLAGLPSISQSVPVTFVIRMDTK